MGGKLVHISGKTYRVNLNCELTDGQKILCTKFKPVECHKCKHYKASLEAPDFYEILNSKHKGEN